MNNRQELKKSIKKKTISCNGVFTDELDEKNLADQHPLIYLSISKDEKISCPYCAKIFIYNE